MSLELEQERLLIEKSKEDLASFGKLYDEYYSKIFGYTLRRTASIEDAQDITSQTFFQALHNLHQFRWRGISFSSWLYRIANNEIADHYKRNKSRQFHYAEVAKEAAVHRSSPEDELSQAEDELKKHEDFLSLHRNLSRLPAKYQEVITLRFFEDKDILEICEILGKPEGTVKSLLHRGLEKLRTLME